MQKNNAAEINPCEIIWIIEPSRPMIAADELEPIKLNTRKIPSVTKPI